MGVEIPHSGKSSGIVLEFSQYRRPRIEEESGGFERILTRQEELRALVAAQVAQFTESVPLSREERDIFLQAVRLYLDDPRHRGSLRSGVFGNPVQDIMMVLIEGLKAAHNERYVVRVQKTAQGRIDIANSLLILQTPEGLRILAELFYQKTGGNLVVQFVQQLEKDRRRTLYHLQKIENHGRDGWSLLLKPIPGSGTTKVTIRPRQVIADKFPPLACFVLLPEVVESNPDEEPEDDPEEPKRA